MCPACFRGRSVDHTFTPASSLEDSGDQRRTKSNEIIAETERVVVTGSYSHRGN